MAEVNGRMVEKFKGMPKFTVELSTGGALGGGVVRIDDETHLDFWLEIQLSPEDLEVLAGKVRIGGK